MALSLSSAEQDALEADAIAVRNLVEFDLDSGAAYFWDDFGTLAYDPGTGSKNYVGTGFLGTIEQVTQSKSLTAQGVSFRLSGIDQAAGAGAGDLLTSFDDEDFHGREVIHRLLILDATVGGESVIGNIRVYRGFIDQADLVDDPAGEGSYIEIRAESAAKELGRVEPRFRTQADQEDLFSGVTDDFFSFVATAVLQQPNWGSQQRSVSPTGGRGNAGGGLPGNNGVYR